jgi:hypothetical protein
MKKLLLVPVICFLSQISFGQTNVTAHKKTNSASDPQLAEFKSRHDVVTAKNAQSIESAEYFGYAETLKSYFNNGVIPKETPKSDGTLIKEQYLKVLNDWISKNQYMVKSEYKNSLIK